MCEHVYVHPNRKKMIYDFYFCSLQITDNLYIIYIIQIIRVDYTYTRDVGERVCATSSSHTTRVFYSNFHSVSVSFSTSLSIQSYIDHSNNLTVTN